MILRDGAFPMKPWMPEPFDDAVLREKKRYFSYRFRVVHRKCKSSKESVKAMGLPPLFSITFV